MRGLRRDLGRAMTVPRSLLVVVVVAIVLRLPFLTVPPSPDEAGLILIGGQWHDGTSLYGAYWVDRSPLLVTLYEIAAETGGVLALRLLGLAAVALTVVLCGAAARRLGGDRAARWAAATAGLLTVSPWLGADRVNAELLAAPWLALGVYAAVRAVETPRHLRWSVLAGVAAVAAIATKQNHADAGVFLLALVGASLVTRSLSVRSALRIVGVALAGALATVLGVLLWGWLRGTVPTDLFDALFTFRLRAAELMDAAPTQSGRERRTRLLLRAVFSGQVLLLVTVVLAPWWRRGRSPAAIALALTAAYACFSIAASGSWWNHYLVQLAVPLAIGSGLVAARTRLLVPVAVLYTTVAAIVGVVVLRPHLTAVDWHVAAGRMVADVAEAEDTIVNAWGRPDVVLASGLSSPYEHLWSLPVRTDDSDLEQFRELLAGDDAPTWLVTRGSLWAPGIAHEAADEMVWERYRRVAWVCDREILLRRDVSRSHPTIPPDLACTAPVDPR